MGFFSDLMGITPQEDDHEGELYEVRSTLGEEAKPDDRKNRIKALLSTWHREYEHYGKGNMAPTYALEIHALNDDSSKNRSNDPLDDTVNIDNPMEGCGTYIFIPEKMRKASVSVLSNTFSLPISIPDEFDTLKVLSRNYQDEYEQETPPVATRLLTLDMPDYYPIASWGKDTTSDPLNEILAIFDQLGTGQFAGISLLIRMADKNKWRLEGNARVREIEDPTYIAHPTLFQRVKNFLSETPSDMGKKVYRNAGYDRQPLDSFERDEVAAIQNKQTQDLFECTLRLYASSDEIVNELCEAIMQRTSGQFNQFRIASVRCRLEDMALRAHSNLYSFHLSSDEIASIWHIPDDNNAQSKTLHKPAPQVTTPPDSVVIVPDNGVGDIKFLLKNYVKRQVMQESDVPQLQG